MKQLIMAIVQTSSECNMNCEYCYVMASRTIRRKMSVPEVEKLVHNVAVGFDSVKFCWHGGEPLIVGMDFYNSVLEIQRYLTKKWNTAFKNSLQTNGTLLNDEWLQFFEDNKFSIGVSYDAPPDVHYSRRIRGNSKLESQVANSIELLRRRRFPLNFLCVISSSNVHRGVEIFNHFSSIDSNSYSLLPLMEVSEEQRSESIMNEELFELYRTTFELWLNQENEPSLLVEPIHTMVRSLLGVAPQLCSFSSPCLKRMVTITPDGNVIPCGSLTAPEFILGDIFREPLKKILFSERVRELKQGHSALVDSKCAECEFVSVCRGGCRESSFWHTGEYNGQYPYCQARKETFKYMRSRLSDILEKSLGSS